MRQIAGFSAVCLTLIAATLGLLHLLFRQPDERRALWIGAGIAVVVQLVAFLIARRMRQRNVFAGWGLGVALRFVALAVVALVVAPSLDLPLTAALVGLAMFLFVSTLVEPLFLKS